MADTAGKPITCKAAVMWEARKPLSIETIEVEPPKAGEIRIQMKYTGICHSDENYLNGSRPWNTPLILGHEGSGIVESIGHGVTGVKTGDHVIPMFVPHCNKCRSCSSGKTNICDNLRNKTYSAGVMSDNTTRFSYNGEPVYHFINTSTFSQYTVVADTSVGKVDPSAPLDKVCLLGCGIATGYGAAINTAKVEPGSVCAVWGLGPIGLATIMGCKKAGASRIIGIDINPNKFKLGKQFGMTEALNPADYERPLQEILIQMTEGGLDYAFECVGNVNTMKTAFESTHRGFGKTILLGVAPDADNFVTKPYSITMGKQIMGSLYGGWIGKQDITKLVDAYNKKDILLDEFITHRMGLNRINEGFDLMRNGKSLRTVIDLWA